MLAILYGKDIRGLRVLNFLVHSVWGVLISLHLMGVVSVNLPNTIQPRYEYILALIGVTITFSLLSLRDYPQRDKLKYVSLTLGSLVQTLIGLKYVTNYPPFDIIIIANSLLALWFFGGAMYVKQIADKELPNGTGDVAD